MSNYRLWEEYHRYFVYPLACGSGWYHWGDDGWEVVVSFAPICPCASIWLEELGESVE